MAYIFVLQPAPSMHMSIEWLPPISLRDGSAVGMTYTCDELDELPTTAGVYVFGRRHGRRFTPIYIGKASNLSVRIPQQLNNNKLMTALRSAPSGQRQLMVGALIGKRGQEVDKAVKVAERALIKHALSHGHDIVNKQGTRIQAHTAVMLGSRAARDWLMTASVQMEYGSRAS